VPVDIDELWTIDEAVEELAKVGITVKPVTLRVWIHRGHLPVAERDESGRPKLRPLDVAKAEYATRGHARRQVGRLPPPSAYHKVA
jgi:predicted site-specific integrase-resolvase